MRKQGLIHLHGLAAEIRNHMEEKYGENLSNDYFQQYDSMDVKPKYINKDKDTHRDAMKVLFKGLETHIEEELEENCSQEECAVRS